MFFAKLIEILRARHLDWTVRTGRRPRDVGGVAQPLPVQQQAEDLRDGGGERGAVDQRAAARHGDRVVEGLRPEVVVDEGRHQPRLGQAQPRAHELGAVLHEDGHGVALGEALGQEEVGDPVTPLLHLPEGPLLVAVVEQHLVRAPGHRPGEALGHGHVPVLLHLGAEHQAAHLLDGGEVARQRPGHQVEGVAAAGEQPARPHHAQPHPHAGVGQQQRRAQPQQRAVPRPRTHHVRCELCC